MTMIDGPYAGQRFRKVADWSLRLLDRAGELTPVSCPLNLAKNPRTPNAW